MSSRLFRLALLSIIVLALLPHADSARAEGAGEKVAKPSTEKKAKRSRGTREKDAEGTQAADRFEADTVIKSQYQLNGEHLEVDPD